MEKTFKEIQGMDKKYIFLFPLTNRGSELPSFKSNAINFRLAMTHRGNPECKASHHVSITLLPQLVPG